MPLLSSGLWVPSLWSGPSGPRAYLRRTRQGLPQTNLQLWLKADAITGLVDGDPLGTWTDSSGNSVSVSQATSTQKPTYKTGIVNGLPVVRSDGVDDNLLVSLNLSSGPQTYFAVVSPPAAANKVLFDTETGRLLLYPYSGGSSGRMGWYANAWHDNIADGTTGFQLLTWRLASAGGEVWRNGTSLGTDTHSEVAISGTTRLFSTHDGFAYMACDLAEFLIYNAALSTTDRQAVESYLISKYAL